jgi:hypothetical protein
MIYFIFSKSIYKILFFLDHNNGHEIKFENVLNAAELIIEYN